MRPFDWERERVFDGYDPTCDESPGFDAVFHGFAYPTEDDAIVQDACCTCKQDAGEPETATLCDSCIYRLTAEAA